MPKQLLFSITKKDLDISYFSGTGGGGQYRNKHQNCVRIQHKESGAVGTGQSGRDRISNTREAFSSLVKSPKFRIWNFNKAREIIEEKTIEEKVENSCTKENLVWEIKDANGRWTLDSGEES